MREATAGSLARPARYPDNAADGTARRFPCQEPAEKFERASLQLPQDLPVSLPSKLVEQRPDVQSAEAQFHSARASIGVAVAAILPQFTLLPSAGLASNKFDRLFMTPGIAFWTLVGTSRRRSSTPGPCCTRNVRPTPPLTKLQRCIAAP